MIGNVRYVFDVNDTHDTLFLILSCKNVICRFTVV